METLMLELSRVGCKQMAVEKRGIFQPEAVKVWQKDSEIVWSAWRHAAAKAGSVLRAESNVTDEMSHLRIFNSMWRDLKAERPELFTPQVLKDCRQIIKEAAQMEMAWGKHIIEGGILGLTDHIVDGHVMHNANMVVNAVGLEPVFPEVTKDPLEWTNTYLREHGIETNFFEDKVIEYEDAPLSFD